MDYLTALYSLNIHFSGSRFCVLFVDKRAKTQFRLKSEYSLSFECLPRVVDPGEGVG